MSGEQLLFDQWSLNYAERRAISRLSLTAEPVENLDGIGQPTMDKLVAKGIAKKVGIHPLGMALYGLTETGYLIANASAKPDE